VSAPSSGGDRFVPTADIRAAIKGHEADLLDALSIRWREGTPHITCPYPDHADHHPSWRWDARKRKAFCTCGSRDAFGVLMAIEGIDFDQAKTRAAELLKRKDLIRERRKKK
jgi:DNA primase